jgi:hypothetical protein
MKSRVFLKNPFRIASYSIKPNSLPRDRSAPMPPPTGDAPRGGITPKSRSRVCRLWRNGLTALFFTLTFALATSANSQTRSGGSEEIGAGGTLSLNEKRIAADKTITVSTTTTFVFRFASDYQAYAAIIPSSSISNFRNGGSFSQYSQFDGTIGTVTVTLGPGTYAVGIANRSNSSSNQFKVELDLPVTFSNAGIATTVLNETRYVGANGGRLEQEFTIASGYYYYMDGANSGLDTSIIPSSELSKFRNGLTFNRYSEYSGDQDDDLPGGYTINLPPGTYYLCFHNTSSNAKAVVYTMQGFADNSGGGGGGGTTGDILYPRFGGERAAWRSRSRNTRMTLTVPSIRNESTTRTTESLRVYLVAGGRTVAISSYSPLSPGYFYPAGTRSVRMYRPPRGRVRTSMLLAEYNGSSFITRSVRNFPGTVRFR